MKNLNFITNTNCWLMKQLSAKLSPLMLILITVSSISVKANDPLTSAFKMPNGNNPLLTNKAKATEKKENLPTKEKLKENLGGNGMNFTPNQGQVADMSGALRSDVLYTSDAGNASVYLRKTGLSYVITNMGAVMHDIDEEVEEAEHSGKLGIGGEEKLKEELMAKAKVKGYRVDIDFVNCNANIRTINEDAISGKLNFYYPHCKDGVTGLSQYNKITYQNLYHHIDAIYYGGKAQGLKYDLVVQPGGNPKDIQLKYSGADKITLVNGKIQVKTALGNIQEWMPKVYQNINGNEVKIKAEYVLAPSPSGRDGEGLLSFNVGTYNPNYPLIIDPWITYYGGSDSEEGNSIANDNIGNVLVTGNTRSFPFPVSAGAFQIAYAGNIDAFVLSITPNGMTRNFATYFGGTSVDQGNGICSDATNNVVFCGETFSNDLPCVAIGTNVVFQNTVSGGQNGFLVKLNQSGVLEFATFYNGPMTDVCTDLFDNIIAYGKTSNSVNVATVGAIKTLQSAQDAFVVKFQNNGLRLWGTYFGGSSLETSSGVCVDRNTNDIYFTGLTQSTDFTVTTGAHQVTYGTGIDAYLTKLSPTGALLWSTYYGGTGDDYGYAVCTDQASNVIIGGRTTTTTSPTIRTIGPVYAGGSGDAFIAKFNSAGLRQWGTYMGGTGLLLGDYCTGLACDANNNIVAGGDTYSSDLTVTSCAFQTTKKGNEDNWLGTFSPNGNIICLGYLGATGIGDTETREGFGGSISVFGCQSHIVGSSKNQWPVTSGAYQTAYAGGTYDVDIAQLDISSCGLPLMPSATSNTVASIGCNCSGAVTLTLTAGCKLPPFSYYYSNGAQTINTTALSNSLTNLCAGVYNYTVMTSCDAISGSFTIGGTTNTITVTSSVTPANCASATGSVTINNVSAPANYTITEGSAIIATNVNVPFTIPGVSVGNHIYTIISSNGCSTSFSASVWTETITVNPTANLFCNSNTATLSANSSNALATYSWSGTGIVSGINTKTPVVNQAGTYTVGVTYGSCTSFSLVTVTQNTTVPISISSNPLNCINLTSTLTAVSAGNLIVWNGGALPINSANPATVNASGNYTVTATNTLTGCSSSSLVTITQNTIAPAPPSFSLATGTSFTLTCINTFIQIRGFSSGVSVVFSPIGFNPLTITSPANYTATATNPFTGCTSSSVITVSQNTIVPNRGATVSNSITCLTPTATLTGTSITPGVTYSWSPLGVTSQTVSTNITGNHTLIVTDPVNGCKSNTVVTVLKDPATPTVTASFNQTLTCINTTATLTAVSSGNNIVWNGGALINATNPATVNAGGIYTATATQTLPACSASTLITVIQNTTTPIINNFSPAILTCLAPSFRINTKFNSPGSTTSWNGSGLATNSPATATITVAGNYSATAIHNTSGCTSFSVFTVLSNTITDVSATISNSLSCANPTALLTGTSTTSGLNFYTWSPSGLTTNTLLENTPGNYTLQVLNSTNGCISTTVITVSGSTNSLTLNPSITNATCGTGTVSIGITGGAPNYTITEGGLNLASGASNSYTLTGVSVGSHTYVVSSTNSCNQTLVVNIMDLCPLPIELTKFSASCADRKATIKWTTASEINCDTFLLYRRTNHIDFAAPIAKVKGSVNSYTVNHYEVVDDNLEVDSIYYYKLEQVDLDKTVHEVGQIIYAHCVPVKFNYNFNSYLSGDVLT
ncbi:MAG: beta strand repeat-containing protein, partial [Bacteroidota bacterium]